MLIVTFDRCLHGKMMEILQREGADALAKLYWEHRYSESVEIRGGVMEYMYCRLFYSTSNLKTFLLEC